MTAEYGWKQQVTELLNELIRRQSVTPDDAGCQALMAERLERIGFHTEWMPFNDVTNLWARRGESGPVFCFAGHTDVVPPGPLENWDSHPFQPELRDGLVFGRGAADMKASLAAMVVALERFLEGRDSFNGSIALLITSDEEGRARDGTLKVIEALSERGENIDWCVIGEPSSQARLGDIVRIGRRGSLSAMLKVHGVQGHVAYPALADNPIRRFAPVLAELNGVEWDQGNDYFPPTSFQVVNVHSGIGAPNVTPGELTARFNFRYCTEWHHEELREKVHSIFDAHDINYEIDWHLSGEPFLTQPGRLIDTVAETVESFSGKSPELSTGGGTSDGRFISPAGVDVVELGPVNASIHKVNEHVRLEDVHELTLMYERILERLMA